MLLDEIREEEKFEHDKDDEQFDEDDGPQSFPQRHVAEAISIEVIYSV